MAAVALDDRVESDGPVDLAEESGEEVDVGVRHQLNGRTGPLVRALGHPGVDEPQLGAAASRVHEPPVGIG